MDPGPIRTDDEHRAALAEIESLWGAPEGTEQGDKLDLHLALVEITKAGAGRSRSMTHPFDARSPSR